MQVPLGGSNTLWGNGLIISFSVCPVSSSLHLGSTSVQCVSGRAEESKVGLEGGEKADFPEIEPSCGRTGGQITALDLRMWVTPCAPKLQGTKVLGPNRQGQMNRKSLPSPPDLCPSV